MGTVCYFYPNRSLNSIRSIAADYAIRHGRHQPLEYFLAKLPTVPPAKPYTEDPSPPKAVVPKLKNDNSTEDEDEKVNMYPEWPLLRPTCHVIIQKGDTCEGIVAGYGIYSLKRFKQMNFGIQCDDLIIGKVIYIRRDYPCGEPYPESRAVMPQKYDLLDSAHATLRQRFGERGPTIVLIILGLLLVGGAIFLLYPRQERAEPADPHPVFLPVKEDGTPVAVKNTDAIVAVPNVPVADDNEPKCYAGVNEGDHCEAFVGGYGITSVARLMEMNPGLKCPGDGALMTVGHNIVIRKGQGCGTECTKELC
ncbi:hypothetical protein BV898_02577 [Hypsibius exemplaris]|uniref:LysM domain-containing protein n=1 Tax=Hypsibius exemplaris TaxID=2072580 RepID=A0A1W0X7C6_HYPEX|nr:hypothetical protein BV898_02577 [Hypsibius exemplaris]